MGRAAYEKEIDGHLEVLKNNTPAVVKETNDKYKKKHQKYLVDNKVQIQEMQKELAKLDLNSQEKIQEKFITGEYK